MDLIEAANDLSPDEEIELIRLLTKAGQGPWPEIVFRAIHQTVSMWATELVITRNSDKEILLAKYDGGVAEFLGKWHLPGGYNYRSELDIAETVSRIGWREVRADVTFDRVIGAYKWAPGEHPYGRPLSIFARCDGHGVVESDAMQYFHIDHLPDNMIEPQKRFIEDAFCV